VTARPVELLTGPEVGASDKTCYRQLPRSRPYPADNGKADFRAKTALTLDTLANGADPSAVALARALEALAELRGIFADYFARCDQILAAWQARP
jgi:hypothetical protein